jgi:hypothetical protein
MDSMSMTPLRHFRVTFILFYLKGALLWRSNFPGNKKKCSWFQTFTVFLTDYVQYYSFRELFIELYHKNQPNAKYSMSMSGDHFPVGARFSATVQACPEVHPSFLHNGYRILHGLKWSGRGVDHPSSSSAGVKGRVKLYPYSLSGPSWPALG